jgi:hypothetical protein
MISIFHTRLRLSPLHDDSHTHDSFSLVQTFSLSDIHVRLLLKDIALVPKAKNPQSFEDVNKPYPSGAGIRAESR